MSLFLSRVALSPYSARAMRLVGSPADLHAVLVALFDGPTEGRVLFRVDAGERGPDLLIQSAAVPDWARLGLEDRDLRDEPATKPLVVGVSAGTPLGFRLLARPVRRLSTGKGKGPGARNDLRTDEERLPWLHRKAEASGFRVATCGMTLMTFAALHSDRPLRAKGGSFTAVRFDGELIVTDPDKLREAVAQGIGTQKAFGFGLLSLAAVHSVPADLHLLPKFRDRLSYLYVEHAVVEREANSIALYQKDPEGEELGVVQVPVADIALLMLGPGTKLSHAAVDVLARNSCLVAWTGEEGVRLYAFGTGGTHSAERLLRQARMVSDPALRLLTVRRLYGMRFPEALDEGVTIEQLRGKEGYRVREAYRRLAEANGLEWQGRSYDRNRWQGADPANRALSAATACLYGVCHAAILGMGFSPALGFIHTGKQLSFVYDLADLYKLELAVPVAFREAADEGENLDRRVRVALRDGFRETRFMERVADDLMRIFGPDEDDVEVYDEDKALPGPLVGGAEGGVSYAPSEEEA